jgi:hypothetical protein
MPNCGTMIFGNVPLAIILPSFPLTDLSGP